MDKSTVIGLVVGVTTIIVGILLGGSLLSFINMPSVFIVIGGTFAAVLINFPLNDVMATVKVLKNAFREKNESMKGVIDDLVSMSEKARREGILAIEQALEDIDDPFMQGGLRLAVDGSEPEAIKDSMEIEMDNVEKRHQKGHAITDAAGIFAPGFGMIGTLIGLINMLQTMSDPASIGPSMAVALITTLYGAVLSNLVFLPLKGKLEQRTAAEMTKKELIIEGVIGIQGGENPRMLRAKLETYLPPTLRSVDEG